MKVARVARPVRRFGALGVVVVLGAAVLVGSAVATPTSDKPDLVPLLPTETGTQQAVAPIYTDTFVRPGRVLYRFSSVIKNLGGAMDLYKDPYDRRRDAGCLAWRQPDHDARPEPRADRRHHREPDRRARRVLHLQSQPGPQPLALPAGGPVPAGPPRWRDPLLGQGRLLHVGQLGQGRRRLDQVLPGQLQGRRARRAGALPRIPPRPSPGWASRATTATSTPRSRPTSGWTSAASAPAATRCGRSSTRTGSSTSPTRATTR